MTQTERRTRNLAAALMRTTPLSSAEAFRRAAIIIAARAAR